MGTYSKIIRNCLLLIPAVLLVQQFTGYPGLRKLDGAYNKEKAPQLSWELWSNQSFQNQLERYLNENFGYRNTGVRIRNQLLHSVFQQSTNAKVYHFDNNNLINIGYIDAYLGKNKVEEEEIKNKCKDFARISKYMKDKNKLMFVVIAPDKANYFTDEFNLPPRESIDSSNYKVWVRYLEEYQIPFIDFQDFFYQQKNITEHPLFPATGIHWSTYGRNLAFDSISGFIAKHLNFEMPRMVVSEIKKRRKYDPIERDLEQTLNLLFNLNTPPLSYQSFTLNNQPMCRFMIVADSYFYDFYSTGVTQHFFAETYFWYYNTTAMQFGNNDFDNEPRNHDLKDLIDNKIDVLCLMSTNPNLDKFPWLFEGALLEAVSAKDSI